jgi:hypothetical protein
MMVCEDDELDICRLETFLFNVIDDLLCVVRRSRVYDGELLSVGDQIDVGMGHVFARLIDSMYSIDYLHESHLLRIRTLMVGWNINRWRTVKG